MFKRNKVLFLGGIAALAVFLLVQWLVVQANGAQAQKKLKDAGDERENWNKFFKTGEGLLPKPQAEADLRESNEKLRAQFEELKKIEFGTAVTLHAFSVDAAGTGGDPRNYFTSMQKQTIAKAKDFGISVPPDLGFPAATLEEPVALNLLRLALVDRLLAACKEVAITKIDSIHFEKPRLAPGTPEDEDADPQESKKKSAKAQPPKTDSVEKLRQFPLRVRVITPERTVAHLLLELQRPSTDKRGFFCLGSFGVTVRLAGSGKVEAEFSLAALLSENTLKQLAIPLQAADERRNGSRERDFNTDRY